MITLWRSTVCAIILAGAGGGTVLRRSARRRSALALRAVLTG